IDLAAEILFGDFRDPACRRAADIIDEDVDAAEFFLAGSRHGGDLRIVENVANMRDDLAVIADPRHGLAHRLRILVDCADLAPLAGEQHRGRASIAPAWADTARSGNQRNLALDSSRHPF